MKDLYPVTSCYICDSSITIKRYIPKNLPHKTRIYQCRVCKHVSITPFPSDVFLFELYAIKSELVLGKDFVESNSIQDTGAKKFRADPHTWISKLLQNYPTGDLLDFGCADGKLVDFLNSRGWQALGVDISGFRRETNFYTTLNEIDSPRKFRYIVLQDVLEHLSDPKDIIDQLRRRTLEGGKWFISIPTSSSFEYKLLGERWTMISPYGHLHFFSHKSISRLLSEAEFKILSINRRRKPSIWMREIINLVRLCASIPYSLFRFKGTKHLQSRVSSLINSVVYLISRGDQFDIICEYSPTRTSLERVTTSNH